MIYSHHKMTTKKNDEREKNNILKLLVLFASYDYYMYVNNVCIAYIRMSNIF